jgi:membrane-bound acyltransferase YfiQ involved in biofilm formation
MGLLFLVIKVIHKALFHFREVRYDENMKLLDKKNLIALLLILVMSFVVFFSVSNSLRQLAQAIGNLHTANR